MKKFIKIVSLFIFIAISSLHAMVDIQIAEPQQMDSFTYQSDDSPKKDHKLRGTLVTCDQKVIDTYKTVWATVTDSKEISNETIAKIDSLNQLHECGCVTSRFMKGLRAEVEEDETFIVPYKELFRHKKNTQLTIGKFFEQAVIHSIRENFVIPPSAQICYVSVGSGGLLLDLRLLIALQKAGYENLVIVLIDNDNLDLTKLANKHTQRIYTEFCTRYKKQEKITNPKNCIEQFCAALSASGMQTTIYVYNSLEAYYKDCATHENLIPNIVVEVDTPHKTFECDKFENLLHLSLHESSTYTTADLGINGTTIEIESSPPAK